MRFPAGMIIMNMLLPFTIKDNGARKGMPYNEYNDKILEHFNNPRNVGRLDPEDDQVGTGVAENPAKGDLIRFQILVDAGGLITEARFKAYGCGSAIASASLLTTLVVGLNIDEADVPRHGEIAGLLDLPTDKITSAALADEAFREALSNYRQKSGAQAEQKKV
jgi:nitrogen fixation NifU-like protein